MRVCRQISGADFADIERIGTAIDAEFPSVRGTRSVFGKRTGGGFFLDIELDRDALARYSLSRHRLISISYTTIVALSRQHEGNRQSATATGVQWLQNVRLERLLDARDLNIC